MNLAQETRNPPSIRRKSRKQPRPRRRMAFKGTKLFVCHPLCICVFCRPNLLKIPGQCTGLVMDFMLEWPLDFTIHKYADLLGDNLKTNERDSYWWTNVVRPNNKVDLIQFGIFNRYIRALRKRKLHPLVTAMMSGNISRVPWSLYDDGTWDTIPESLRDITEENQDRVNGLVFLEVSRRAFNTHIFKLELQMERIEIHEDGLFQFSPMSWRFSVRPRWKFICSKQQILPPKVLFHPPRASQRTIIGDQLQTFKEIQSAIELDEEAWSDTVKVNMQLVMKMGSWLPYMSFVSAAYECKSRHLEQYYHIGIEPSEYEYVAGFVDRLNTYGNFYDVTIPLMEVLTGAKGGDGKRMLVCSPYTLRNGLLTNAVSTEHVIELYLKPNCPQDIFYI